MTSCIKNHFFIVLPIEHKSPSFRIQCVFIIVIAIFYVLAPVVVRKMFSLRELKALIISVVNFQSQFVVGVFNDLDANIFCHLFRFDPPC